MKPEYTDSPDETDFPLIDHCAVCDRICDWQPRYEMAMRSAEHQALLTSKRPLNYVPEARVVKICADCAGDDNEELKRTIRVLYPVYAALHPSKFGRSN